MCRWKLSTGEEGEGIPSDEERLSDIDISGVSASMRLVANLLGYLSDLPKPPASSPLSGPRAQIESLRLGKEMTYRAGADIKLPGPMSVLRTIGTAGWKIHSRFMVIGHPRNQAYGPNHSLRREKWIQPYWKGPTSAQDVLNRTYKAGGDQ